MSSTPGADWARLHKPGPGQDRAARLAAVGLMDGLSLDQMVQCLDMLGLLPGQEGTRYVPAEAEQPARVRVVNLARMDKGCTPTPTDKTQTYLP